MLNNWQRTTHTTKGADPTTVVTWNDGTIFITEFQQVYTIWDKRNRPEVIGAVVLAEILHSLLESDYQEQLLQELDDDTAEALEADRRFYGHA